MSTAAALSVDRLRAKRAEIMRICAAHGCSRAWVFGSVARGVAHEESDVDLVVDLTGKRTPWWPGGLITELEDLLGVQVDVIRLSAIPQELGASILSEAIEI